MMMDDTMEEEANEREIQRIRRAQHQRLLNDIEQARVESVEQSVVEGLRAKGLLPSAEQPRPEQVGGECADNCHFGDHDDYDIEQERIKFQEELGAAMVNAGAKEVELDALAAPERRKRNDKMYNKSSRQARQHVHFCMFCGQSGTELGNEQHSTPIEQRERLLRLLRPVTSPTACYCAVMGSEKCWHCEARELITTIEQEGTR